MLVAAVLAATGMLVLYKGYRAEVQRDRWLMLERGRTILDALVAGTRAHGRMGRYNAERLEAIFEELAAAPYILALQFEADDGSVIAAAGETALAAGNASKPVHWFTSHLVMVSEPQTLERGPGSSMGPGGRRGPGPNWGMKHGNDAEGGFFGWDPGNRGRFPSDRSADKGTTRPDVMRGPAGPEFGGDSVPPPPGSQGFPAPPRSPRPDLPDWEEWVPFPEGPYRFSVALDTSAMLEQIGRERRQFVLASALYAGGIALAAWLLFALVHQRSLRLALELTEERAAHLERVSQLGAGLAHETKNPLGIVRGLAQTVAASTNADAGIKRAAREIIDEADRTVGRINAFLTLAKPLDPQLEDIDLDGFLRHLLSLVKPELDDAGIEASFAPISVHIRADQDLLRRAILNLVINATRACSRGSKITIEVSTKNDLVSLTVADDGCGIAPADIPHVAEPYFTRFEEGTGLGLAIVDQIARAHEWRLAIESEPGVGTRVSLNGLRQVG